MKKGIIIVRDFENVEPIKQVFPDWLVLASLTTKEEITFYPVPKNEKT
jgi:hypothetical protein